MNTDHQDSLVRYLEYYCKLPFSMAKSAQLEDITLDSMIIANGMGRFIVPIEPPMSTFSEARLRLVNMDEQATNGLGRSKIVVDTFVWPEGLHLVAVTLIIITWMLTITPGHFGPDSIYGAHVLRGNVMLMNFHIAVQPFVLALLVGVHAVELVWFVPARLLKYNVPLLSITALLWASDVMIEGYGSIRRFNKIVESKSIQKAKHSS